MKKKIFNAISIAVFITIPFYCLAQTTYSFRSFPISTTVDIAVDSRGNVYSAQAIFSTTSTYNGLVKLSPQGQQTVMPPPISSGLFSTNPSRIDIDSHDNLYCVSYGNGHVGRFDPQGNYTYLLQLPNSFGADYSTRITVESDTSVIVSTRSSGWRVNTQTNFVTKILNSGYDNLSTIPSHDGTIWQMRTMHTSSTPDRRSIHHFSNSCNLLARYDSLHLQQCSIYDRANYKTFPLEEDTNNNLWFSGCGTGLQKMNKTTGILDSFALSQDSTLYEINDILFDNANNAWIATRIGVIKMDLATQQLMRYDTTSGLLDDHVLSLAKQGNDTIWAGTVRGLTRIVRNTNTNTSENTSKFAPDLWQISPNPTAEFLNITTNNTQSTANFQLFDNLGRLVFETDVSNFKQISLKNLPNGIYFAKLKNENLGVRKIIISSH